MDDQRPRVWVGHIEMETDRLEASEAFMLAIGMRAIARGDDYAVLELRGGTHLVLIRKDRVEPGAAAFDLMVEDLDAAHEALTGQGLNPSSIERGSIHRSFTVHEPCGNEITFNSSHVSDLPV